ncbi:GNAT family N-acetyltransferase [Salinibius halmophilus]|uniref:GNAT family N-acetyltransferase n=1 Tax=Salinibius halmophilus TaxID=1853216 RepID=UPI000E66322A|nr:GNAT family N-acetyltransferase [Salinibius halmophilus]
MIEPINEGNLEAVLPLFRQYQEFYRVSDINDDKNRTFLNQFGEGKPTGCLFGFRHNHQLVAFATVYFSFNSTITSKVAVMNDLYTAPDARGLGIAKQLIQHCRDYAIDQGAARLQWVTAPDNSTAQAVYEALPTKSSQWLFYTLS